MQQADPQLVAKAADFIRRREKSKAELVEELMLLQERVSLLERAQATRDGEPYAAGPGEAGNPIEPEDSRPMLEENIRQLQERNSELEQLTRELEEKVESARDAVEQRESLEEGQTTEAAEWRRRSDDLEKENSRVKKQLEELQLVHDELGEANLNLQKLVDGSPGVHWFLSPDLETTHFNQTFFDFVGESPDNGQRKWRDYLHPKEVDQITETVRNAAEHREPFSLEHRLRCGDGSYRWFWSVAAPCPEGASNFAGGVDAAGGYVGVSLDCSSQREAVQKLAQDSLRRQDQLEQCWRSREKELTQIHRQLHEDLAAPLTNASEHLELMEKQVAELRQLWRCADEVRTHLGTGQSPTLLQQEGLERAISELARHDGSRRGMKVHCDAPGGIPRLSPESESLIFSVVRDLMGNLSGANGAGSLRVTLGTEEGQLRILLEGRKILMEETDPSAAVQHSLEALSGHLRIETVEEGDVQIELTVPASF